MLQVSERGPRQRLAVEFGGMVVLPVMAPTCLWSPATRSTQAVTGMGGEAIIRLQAGPGWTGEPTDYWAPTIWLDLDNTDNDLGGISVTLIDAPGATPSQLVLALGKDGNAYLVDRNNLGGITAPVAQANVFAGGNRGTSAVTIVRMREHILLLITTRAGRSRLTESPRQVLPWSLGHGA
jgi:hypothetical protein